MLLRDDCFYTGFWFELVVIGYRGLKVSSKLALAHGARVLRRPILVSILRLSMGHAHVVICGLLILESLDQIRLGPLHNLDLSVTQQLLLVV